MKRYIVFLVVTILGGCLVGKVLYDKTMDVDALGSEDVYYLEIMRSVNKKELERETLSIDPKLIIKKDNTYICVVCISRNMDNISKVRDIYENKGYVIVEGVMKVSNMQFLNNLEQFDALLLRTRNNDETSTVNSVILSSYEEMVLVR